MPPDDSQTAQNNPDARIVVTGCAAQIAPSKFAAMPEVDLILGNKEKTEIEKYLHNELAEKTIVGDIMSYDDCDPYLITGFEGRHRAFVQIQQGCNHRCSYCIVPYARGKNRSVPLPNILTQIRELLKQGFKEICLTGVDICSYQIDSAAHRPSFSTLVQTILEEIPELPSLQFGSLDPAAIDGKFIALVGKYSNIHPHFHLSVQSGDNDVLKKCAAATRGRALSVFADKYVKSVPKQLSAPILFAVFRPKAMKISKTRLNWFTKRA